jgi:hypothetical protein
MKFHLLNGIKQYIKQYFLVLNDTWGKIFSFKYSLHDTLMR